MKAIILLIGALLLIGTAGCEWGEHERGEHRGGAYDGDYHRAYGHDSRGYPDYEHYPYSR